MLNLEEQNAAVHMAREGATRRKLAARRNARRSVLMPCAPSVASHPTPPNAALSCLYEEICQKLNVSRWKETVRTHYERALEDELRRYTRLNIRPACWIGNHCVDIFFDSLRTKAPGGTSSLAGLVLSVDGYVHDGIEKSKIDRQTGEDLKRLRVGVAVVENNDILHPVVQAQFRGLKTLPRLDSRGRKRLWSRIYLDTILYHASATELMGLFGFDIDALATRAKRGDL